MWRSGEQRRCGINVDKILLRNHTREMVPLLLMSVWNFSVNRTNYDKGVDNYWGWTEFYAVHPLTVLYAEICWRVNNACDER